MTLRLTSSINISIPSQPTSQKITHYSGQPKEKNWFTGERGSADDLPPLGKWQRMKMKNNMRMNSADYEPPTQNTAPPGKPVMSPPSNNQPAVLTILPCRAISSCHSLDEGRGATRDPGIQKLASNIAPKNHQ